MFPTGSGFADGAPDGLAVARELFAGCVPASGSAAMAGQIRALEELRGLLAAAQAEVTAAFVTARRAEQRTAGMPARRVGLGIAQEIGLARRESPFRAGRYAGWATILTTELPHTFAALRAGQTSEWRAMLVARETGWLSREDRAEVDADLGPRLGALGDRQVEADAARLAYQADPRGKIRAIERAAGGRQVGLRPAPDGQCRLNATLPLAQGVEAYAALCKAADAARAAGDERGRGQVMADTLVERVTGQSRAEGVPVTVDLIMTDQALVNDGPRADEPATVNGYGPVPAPLARDLITRTATQTAAQTEAAVRIRRLFTDPAGRLVTMETGSRAFTPAMAEFVRLRDQRCTTPWCGAPIRHTDHVLAVADGGPTSLANAGGKCESCNQAEEAPGWSYTPQADGTVTMTTPTGHDPTTFTRARPPGAPPPDTSPPDMAPPGTRPPATRPPARPATAVRIFRRSWHSYAPARPPG